MNKKMSIKYFKIRLLQPLINPLTFLTPSSSLSLFKRVKSKVKTRTLLSFRAFNPFNKLKLCNVEQLLPKVLLSSISIFSLNSCYILPKNSLPLFRVSATGKLSKVYTRTNFFFFQKENKNRNRGLDAVSKKENGALPFWNQCFDKNRLKNFVLWFLVTYGEYRTVELIEQFKNIGFEYATKAGISLGIDDLKIPPKKSFLILEAEKITNSALHQYNRGEITGVERFQKMIDTWHRTSEILKQEVIENFELTDTLNPVYMMAFSGARGNISQVRQLVGMRGLMANPQGQILDFPIRSNFREGLSLTEYIISTYGARKGIVDTALRTANAGYLTRRLVDVAQHVIVSNFDCGTYKGIFLNDMKEGTKVLYSLQNRLVGRVLGKTLFSRPSLHTKEQIPLSSAKPVLKATRSNSVTEWSFNQKASSKIIDKSVAPVYLRNTEISITLAMELCKISKGAPSPKIFVRSSLTCETQKSVCQLCYGWSLAQGNLVSIGEAVGVVAAQSVGEPGTQLTMRTFHTGGVFTGDVTDQIKALYNGFVKYLEPIAGTLIRTPEGKIAFLTKTEGFIEVISYLAPRLLKDSNGTNFQQNNRLVFQSRKEKGIKTFRYISKKNSFDNKKALFIEEKFPYVASTKKKQCLLKKYSFFSQLALFKQEPLSVLFAKRCRSLLLGTPLWFIYTRQLRDGVESFIKNLKKNPELLQDKKIDQEKRKIYKIPSYTLLFVRHGENIVEKQVIAQISNISFLAPIVRDIPAEQSKTGSEKPQSVKTSKQSLSFLKGQQNKRDDAEFTINSEMEGEFYSVKLNLLEKHIGPLGPSSVAASNIDIDPLQGLASLREKLVLKDNIGGPRGANTNPEGEAEAILEACDWGYAWILSGKVYQLPILSDFFPQPGDFVNRKSLMNQIQLKATDKGGKFGFVESKFNSNLLLNKPVLFLELNKTIFKKIGYLFTLPHSNFINSAVLNSVFNKLVTSFLPSLNYRNLEHKEELSFLSSNDVIFTPNSFFSLPSFPYSKGSKFFAIKKKKINSFMSLKNSQINKSHLLLSENHFTHDQLQNSSANWSQNLSLFLEWFPHSKIKTGGIFISDYRTVQSLSYTLSMWPTTITLYDSCFKLSSDLVGNQINKNPILFFPLVLNKLEKKEVPLLENISFEAPARLLPFYSEIKINNPQTSKNRLNSKKPSYPLEAPTFKNKKFCLVSKQVTVLSGSAQLKKKKNLAGLYFDPIVTKSNKWLHLLQIKKFKLFDQMKKKPYYNNIKLTTQRTSLYKNEFSHFIWVAKQHFEIPKERFCLESREILLKHAANTGLAPFQNRGLAQQTRQFSITKNSENSFTSSFFADAFGVQPLIFKKNRQGIKELLNCSISGSFQITKRINLNFIKKQKEKFKRDVVFSCMAHKVATKGLFPETIPLLKTLSTKRGSVSYLFTIKKKTLGQNIQPKLNWSKTLYKKHLLQKSLTRKYWNRIQVVRKKFPSHSSTKSKKRIKKFQNNNIFLTKHMVGSQNSPTFNKFSSNQISSFTSNKALFVIFKKKITALAYQMQIKKAYLKTNQKLKGSLKTTLFNSLLFLYYGSCQEKRKKKILAGHLNNRLRLYQRFSKQENFLLQTTSSLFKSYSAGFHQFKSLKISFNTRITLYPHHLKKIKGEALKLGLSRLGGILANFSGISLESPLKNNLLSRSLFLPFSLVNKEKTNYFDYTSNSTKKVALQKTHQDITNFLVGWRSQGKRYLNPFRYWQKPLPFYFFENKNKFFIQKAFAFTAFSLLKEDPKLTLEPLKIPGFLKKKRAFKSIKKKVSTRKQLSHLNKLSTLNQNIAITFKKGWLYFPFNKPQVHGSILPTSISNLKESNGFMNNNSNKFKTEKGEAFNFKAVNNHKSLINPGHFVTKGLLFDINKIYLEWFLLKSLKLLKGLMKRQLFVKNNNFLKMEFSNNWQKTLTSKETEVIVEGGLLTRSIPKEFSTTQLNRKTINNLSWVSNKKCRFFSHPVESNSFLFAPSVILIQKGLEIPIHQSRDYKIEITEVYKRSADSIITDSKLFLISGLVGRGLTKVKFPNKYNTDLTLILTTILHSIKNQNQDSVTKMNATYNSKINCLSVSSEKTEPSSSKRLDPVVCHSSLNIIFEPRILRERFLQTIPHFKPPFLYQSLTEELEKNIFPFEKIKHVNTLPTEKISFFSQKIYVWKSIKTQNLNKLINIKPCIKTNIQLYKNKSYNSLLIQKQLRCSNLNKQKKSIQPFLVNWPTLNLDFKVKKGTLSLYKMISLGRHYSNITEPPRLSRFSFFKKIAKLLRTDSLKKEPLLIILERAAATKKKVFKKIIKPYASTVKTILFKKPINISPLLIGYNIPYGSDLDFNITNIHLNAKFHPPGFRKGRSARRNLTHNLRTAIYPKKLESHKQTKPKNQKMFQLLNLVHEYGIPSRKLAFSFAQPCFSFFLSKKLGVRSTVQQPLKSNFIRFLISGKVLKPKIAFSRELLFRITPFSKKIKQRNSLSLSNYLFSSRVSFKKPSKENKKVFMTLDTNGSSLYDNKFVSSNPFIKSSYLSSFIGEFVKAKAFVAPSFIEHHNQEKALKLISNPISKNENKLENPVSTLVSRPLKTNQIHKSGSVKQVGGGCIILTKPNLICFSFEKVTPLLLKQKPVHRSGLVLGLLTVPTEWLIEEQNPTSPPLGKNEISSEKKLFFGRTITSGLFSYFKKQEILLLKTFLFNNNDSSQAFQNNKEKSSLSLTLKKLFSHFLKKRMRLLWSQRVFSRLASLRVKKIFGKQKQPLQLLSLRGTFKETRENLSKEMSNLCKRSLQTISIHPLDYPSAEMVSPLLTSPTSLFNNLTKFNTDSSQESLSLQIDSSLDSIYLKDLANNIFSTSTISGETAKKNLEFFEETISQVVLPLHFPSSSNGNFIPEGLQQVSYPPFIPLLNLTSSSNSIPLKNMNLKNPFENTSSKPFLDDSLNQVLSESKELLFRMTLPKPDEGSLFGLTALKKQPQSFTPILNIKGLVTGFNKGHNQSLFTNQLSLGEFFVYGDKILPSSFLRQSLTTKTSSQKHSLQRFSIQNKSDSLKTAFGNNFFNSTDSKGLIKTTKLDNTFESKEKTTQAFLNKTSNITLQSEGVAVPTSGQIIHIGINKITLRRAQPIFISPKSILHVSDGSFVLNNDPVMTLTYQRLKTGDIVQGIPKVEQYLEARITKQGRLFRDCLPNLLKGLFKRYRSQLPLERAVRQSFYKIQQIIVDGVLRVYRSQGVTIADKHLEVIVKQMTSKVKIINGAQTGFFPGEIIDLHFVERVNFSLMKKIQYEPLILGITRAALEVDSFLSAASFQQTTRVLSSAAIEKRKDFLKGLKENILLGNLMPAGTGYLVYLEEISF